ncbi:hypothetical protein F5148DRAFT_1152790 [Russula earlei]|uniref:Uncharacterized protein n=1 Tax=Russula earlei TaxID=71964 RepID=A0ACC0TWD6_9AGAM|nr:hypothetical protein F5148DRAFT_1152790 [Russula earlei]
MVAGPITIQALPNEVLLSIFAFHRLLFRTDICPPSAAWRWHRLAHVCQRWRRLIFSSLSLLGARLITPRKSPKTTLDSWPAFPLSICHKSNSISPEELVDLTATLEHSDRIHEIYFHVAFLPSQLYSPSLWKNRLFPELEHLTLVGSRPYEVPRFPPTFMSTSSTTPHGRLRSIVLSNVHLHTLLQILPSSPRLVSLHLGLYILNGGGFISPMSLSTALSGSTQLEYLYIENHPDEPSQAQTIQNLSPRDRIVFPALAYFRVRCSIRYLEAFVSWIDSPRLEKLIVYFDKHVSDIPQLSYFISRTEHLSSLPFRTSILLNAGAFSITHCFRNSPSAHEEFRLHFKCTDRDGWDVLQVERICAQLCGLMSNIKQLKISAFGLPANLPHKTDPAPWLQLLAPYNSVEEIELWSKGASGSGIARALVQSNGKTQEVLPVLRVLELRHFNSWASHLVNEFVAARLLTGRPIIMRRLKKNDKETDWDMFEK